jgi:hypothetical protein
MDGNMHSCGAAVEAWGVSSEVHNSTHPYIGPKRVLADWDVGASAQ